MGAVGVVGVIFFGISSSAELIFPIWRQERHSGRHVIKRIGLVWYLYGLRLRFRRVFKLSPVSKAVQYIVLVRQSGRLAVTYWTITIKSLSKCCAFSYHSLLSSSSSSINISWRTIRDPVVAVGAHILCTPPPGLRAPPTHSYSYPTTPHLHVIHYILHIINKISTFRKHSQK